MNYLIHFQEWITSFFLWFGELIDINELTFYLVLSNFGILSVKIVKFQKKCQWNTFLFRNYIRLILWCFFTLRIFFWNVVNYDKILNLKIKNEYGDWLWWRTTFTRNSWKYASFIGRLTYSNKLMLTHI